MEFLTAFGNWCGGPGFWQGGGGGWGMGFMPFHFGGILQLLVIGLMVYFIARMFRRPVSVAGPDSAEATLRERFARGEIDEQTFQDMKKTLGRP